MKKRMLCWNVNGYRAVAKKGFLRWLYRTKPDILCVQETKANQEQVKKELKQPKGYNAYWATCKKKKGYSGVVTFSKEKAKKVKYGIGIKRFDDEGRIIITEFKNFTLLNVYFPNGKMSKERLKYKMDFYNAFLRFADRLKKGEKLVICGDLNTAHNEIDLKNPKPNDLFSGFLPKERKWIDKFISHGFIDTFRHLYPKKVAYSYWTIRFKTARQKNIGWRLDYFFVTKNLIKKVKDSFMMPKVKGSDHCPVGIDIVI